MAEVTRCLNLNTPTSWVMDEGHNKVSNTTVYSGSFLYNYQWCANGAVQSGETDSTQKSVNSTTVSVSIVRNRIIYF